jgi:DNA polymerase-3 subunit alpha
MVRIISKISLGTQPVFDIGVQSNDHNFVLANGFVASNCFNKSHSTAYGYVTYQTAYLKANYPVEYMAALLSANQGDQDKVQRYIATCLSMGIKVEPPDINRSGTDFTPLQNSILFGLSAVRNVGNGAVENILKAREAGGTFKSLADLCDRIDPRTVNRRSLEALIQSGAMDCIETNRNQLMHDLELVLDWAQSRAKDREVGQGNLFDLMFGGESSHGKGANGFESAPKAPSTADFPPQEKLKLEKELLGFYISDHPLKAVQQAAKVLAPISLTSLTDKPDNVTLSAIVMISSLKPVVTKKGERMAVLQIEDLTGQADAVVFPRSFERIGHWLQVDQQLMIWGKADRRDDRTQFIIDDVEPIDAVRMVMVDLSPNIARDITQQHQLRTVLLEQRGDEDHAKIPVLAIIAGADRREIVRFGAQFRVRDDQSTISALRAAGFQARTSSLTNAN